MKNQDQKHVAFFAAAHKKKSYTAAVKKRLHTIVYDYYSMYKRDLPWRKTKEPYHVLVSEIMLQQTQVDRVCEKFPQFIKAFPSTRALAAAPLTQVLKVWQGMGYNRRALMLKKCAELLMRDFKGALPPTPEALDALPGIGPATAASICAFAFNIPTVFIETNIRTVYLHYFFNGKHNVHDEALRQVVAATVDTKNPRKWYNALMDYGTMLKKEYPNPSRRSAHYARQSTFEGSDRQIRGKILRALTKEPAQFKGLCDAIKADDTTRVQRIITQLKKEGFIRLHKRTYVI